MNIFRKMKIDYQIHTLSIELDSKFSEFENYYKTNFKVVKVCEASSEIQCQVINRIRPKYMNDVIGFASYMHSDDSKVVIYNKGCTRKFEELNKALGETYNKLMLLFREVEFDVTNSRWDFMARNYESMMNVLNKYEAIENPE